MLVLKLSFLSFFLSKYYFFFYSMQEQLKFTWTEQLLKKFENAGFFWGIFQIPVVG